ncbi:hypothetical protein B296_00057934 [Ensete ventricosum]|uniref:Uncharacterized protein n=1 Tax=Ensete ventricosum TaxID=4639 RepID=A0A426X3R8_ENSVE|nr:hypothetical protein B296_00057934 [Ensete ventricosum]
MRYTTYVFCTTPARVASYPLQVPPRSHLCGLIRLDSWRVRASSEADLFLLGLDLSPAEADGCRLDAFVLCVPVGIEGLSFSVKAISADGEEKGEPGDMVLLSQSQSVARGLLDASWGVFFSPRGEKKRLSVWGEGTRRCRPFFIF